MDVILDQSSQDLLCCRVCLLTNCKLFNIHEYKLAEVFSRISGTPVFKGRLPQYLCTYCHTLLLKCDRFRMMCLRTEQCLKKELLQGELNTDCINRIDRRAQRLLQLNRTEVENIDLKAESVIAEPSVSVNINEPKIEIVDDDEDITNTDDGYEANDRDVEEKNTVKEDEANIDEACTDDDDETSSIDMETDVHTFNRHAQKIEKVESFNRVDGESIRKPALKMELEVLKGQLKVKVVKDVKNIKTVTENEETLKEACNYNGNNVSSTRNVKRPMKNINMKVRRNEETNDVKKKVQNQVSTNSKENFNYPGKLNPMLVRKLNMENVIQKKFRYNGRKPENGYLPCFDFPKFENDYEVKIETLTKEEQLEEIAKRRQSDSYKEALFSCEPCGKWFGLETAYNNHRHRHSPSAGQHVCEICTVRFKSLNHRQGHQDTHRLRFTCNRCGFLSRAKYRAKAHYAMHQGKIFRCPYCENTYSKHTSYFTHVRLVHPAMNMACELCGDTFIGEKGLLLHKRLAHKWAQNPKLQQFNCAICPASFVSLDALNRHTNSGKHEGRPCEQCGESCASEEALQAHVREIHPAELHPCEECDGTFSSAAAYDLHYRRKHLNDRRVPALLGSYPYRKNKKNEQHMCEQCGRICMNKGLLILHSYTHMEVKPYGCPHCPKTFVSNQMRTLHIRKHTGERPFHCDQCPRAFSSKANMMRHYRVVHQGLRDRVKCPLCDSVSTTRSSMRVHVAAVHGKQGWPKRAKRNKDKTNKS